MPDYKLYTLIFLTLFLIIASTQMNAVVNSVVSENVIHLQDDEKSYLFFRTKRTTSPQYKFHVDKNLR